MAESLHIPGPQEQVIPRAAVYIDDPGIRPHQITRFDQLKVDDRVVLVGPGLTINTDESITVPHFHDAEQMIHPEVDTYGQYSFEISLAIKALHTRLVGGFSMGPHPNPADYSQLVDDPDYLIAFGQGGEEGEPWDTWQHPSVLTFSKADLGMEPYRGSEGKIAGWSVSYVRPAAEDERVKGPTYYRRSLSPANILRHIRGTRYL